MPNGGQHDTRVSTRAACLAVNKAATANYRDLPPPDFSLSATSSDTIKLALTSPVSDADTYDIQRSMNQVSWTNVEKLLTEEQLADYLDGAKTAEETYYYQVRAVNQHGKSAWSRIKGVKTPSAAAAGTSDSVTGTIANGEQITISALSGESFGATGPTVEFYFDGTGKAAGDAATLADGFDVIDGTAPSSLQPGGKVRPNALLVQPGDGTFAQHEVAFTPTAEALISFWIKVDKINMGPSFKPAWLLDGVNGANSGLYDLVLMTKQNTGSKFAFQGNGSGGTLDYGVLSYVQTNEWVRCTLWLQDRGPSTAQGMYRQLLNASNPMNVLDVVDGALPMFASGISSTSFNRLNVMGHSNSNNGGAAVRVEIDGLYIASDTTKSGLAAARVEIGDAANYADCRELYMCTPDTWADGSITATVHGPDSMAGKYLHIHRADASVAGGVHTNGGVGRLIEDSATGGSSSAGSLTATGTKGHGNTLTITTTGSFGPKQGRAAKLFEYGGEQYFNGVADSTYAGMADQAQLVHGAGPWEHIAGEVRWDKTPANMRKPTIDGCYNGVEAEVNYIGKHSALGGYEPARPAGYDKKYYLRFWLKNSSPMWGRNRHMGYQGPIPTAPAFSLHADAPFRLGEMITWVEPEGATHAGKKARGWIKGFSTDLNGVPFVELSFEYYNYVDANNDLITVYGTPGGYSLTPGTGDVITGVVSGATLTIDQTTAPQNSGGTKLVRVLDNTALDQFSGTLIGTDDASYDPMTKKDANGVEYDTSTVNWKYRARVPELDSSQNPLWVLYEIDYRYYDQGDPACGRSTVVRQNNVVVFKAEMDSVRVPNSANYNRPEHMLSAMNLGKEKPNAVTEHIKQWISEVYQDWSGARVVIGDAPIYDDCGPTEIQRITNWTADQIDVVQYNPEGGYLFVFDDNGTCLNPTEGVLLA